MEDGVFLSFQEGKSATKSTKKTTGINKQTAESASKGTINPATVDTLGAVRDQIKALKVQEEELVDLLKPLFEGGQVFSTPNYVAELVIRNDRIMDQEAVRKKLGQTKYLKIAKAGITDLKKVMGDDDIDECTIDFKEVRVLTVNPVKGG